MFIGTTAESTKYEICQQISDRNVKTQFEILFVSPEQFTQKCMLTRALNAAMQRGTVDLLVLDECHTVLEWGLIFRPAFLEIPVAYPLISQVQILLLTATITKHCLAELKSAFNKPEIHQILAPTLRRANIAVKVEISADGLNNFQTIVDLIRSEVRYKCI